LFHIVFSSRNKKVSTPSKYINGVKGISFLQQKRDITSLLPGYLSKVCLLHFTLSSVSDRKEVSRRLHFAIYQSASRLLFRAAFILKSPRWMSLIPCIPGGACAPARTIRILLFFSNLIAVHQTGHRKILYTVYLLNL
jgi:hypothetical protein